jgi:TolB-like protein/Flp pilus assembly protein TadD
VEPEIERLERSHAFKTSPQLRRLLRFLIKVSAAGDLPDQYRIATQVFGRPKSFDPTADPIVRVEMRRLRARLASYYDAHPKAPFRIDIPERSYTAVITANQGGSVPRIAVLPFRTDSAAPDAPALSDGLADDVIYHLRPDSSLAVLARTSVFSLNAQGMTPQEIAHQVGADWLLRGTLREDQGHWRIETVLYHCPDDHNDGLIEFWHKHWTCTPSLIGTMGQWIGDAIRLSVIGEPSTGADATLARVPHSGAYLHYLQATRLFGRRDSDSVRQAIDLFEQAISEDAQFLRPRIGLLETMWVRGMWGFEMAPLEQRARQLAAECTAIDPDSADARSATALVSVCFEGGFSDSLRLLQTAVEAEPSNLWCCSLYIAALMAAGTREDALRMTRHALQLDPLSPVFRFRLAVLEDYCGFPSEAIDLFQDAIEADPDFSLNYYHQAMALTATGQHQGALSRLELAIEKFGGSPMMLAVKGHVLAKLGQDAAAEAILARLACLSSDGLVSPLLAAFVHTGRNDMEAAAKAVRESVAQGGYCLVPYLVISMMAPLRAWHGWQELSDLVHLSGFRCERGTSPLEG